VVTIQTGRANDKSEAAVGSERSAMGELMTSAEGSLLDDDDDEEEVVPRKAGAGFESAQEPSSARKEGSVRLVLKAASEFPVTFGDLSGSFSSQLFTSAKVF
jgi:hypothetical protein